MLVWGASVCRKAGVLEVAWSSPARRRRLPFDAITLGHVILGRSAEALELLRAHEREHVRQYERWGPVFFLAYPAASLWQWLRGRNPYWFNYFEVQARERSTQASGGPDPLRPARRP
jgi:hypothetical protein